MEDEDGSVELELCIVNFILLLKLVGLKIISYNIFLRYFIQSEMFFLRLIMILCF